jgi:hypothetical protein
MGTKRHDTFMDSKKTERRKVCTLNRRKVSQSNSSGKQYELQWWFLLSQGMIFVMKKLRLAQQKSDSGNYKVPVR